MSTTLLHIEASPRGDRSHSRAITRDFVAAWRQSHPDGKVVTLDIGAEAPPLVNEAWVLGVFTPPETHSPAAQQALAVSDRYVDALVAADELVISTPLYNLGVPAVLKAWIDQIVRAGRTFSAGPEGYKGLLSSKKVRVIVASGGDFRPGSPFWGYNFLEPYLRAIFGFIGLTDLTFVYAYGINLGEETKAESLKAAREAALQLAS